MKNLQPFPQQDSTFLLPGPAGQLEVMTTWPNAPVRGVAVICHPDPRQGGTMNNKVVTILARALGNAGLATVRFNFRGIGLSAGEYGHVQGELADLTAVIDWTKTVLPGQPLWLAGFSFGSYISALAAQSVQPPAVGLISIAPSVNRYDFKQLTSTRCPWLVVHGDQDEVAPFADTQAWAAHPPSPLKFIVMPGASHFFHGRLLELRDHIERWIHLIS